MLAECGSRSNAAKMPHHWVLGLEPPNSAAIVRHSATVQLELRGVAAHGTPVDTPSIDLHQHCPSKMISDSEKTVMSIKGKQSKVGSNGNIYPRIHWFFPQQSKCRERSGGAQWSRSVAPSIMPLFLPPTLIIRPSPWPRLGPTSALHCIAANGSPFTTFKRNISIFITSADVPLYTI